MILFTNGCSWTYGGSLGLDWDYQQDERLTKVWPHHLGQLLSAEKVVNLARGCGSNSRILRTTWQWLNQQPREVLDKTVAVIQWTDPSRYEFYWHRNLNNQWENEESRWIHCKTDVLSNDDQFTDRDKEGNLLPPDIPLLNFLKKTSQSRFQLWSRPQEWSQTVQDLSAMSFLLQTLGVRYFYWYPFNNIHNEFPEDYKKFICERFPWVENISEPTKAIYQRISLTDSHPDLQGHRDIANWLYPSIKLKL